jgi:hypothetical protein
MDDDARGDVGSEAGTVASMRRAGRHTAAVARAALGRRDARAVAAVGALVYVVVYLVGTFDLSLKLGQRALDLRVARDPLALLFRRTAGLHFEPLVAVDAPGFTLLLHPFNLAIAAALGALVALNLAVTVAAIRAPACRAHPSGLAAAFPALLAGASCCAPAIFVLIGIQVSAAFLAVQPVLVPGALALLLGALWYGARGLEPAAIRPRLGADTGTATS